MKPFDWNDLRHFAALAAHGHLARAAQSLGASEATLFRRVRALEAALGSRLFIRRRDGHRLTRAGEALLPLVSEAQGQMGRIAQAFAGEDERHSEAVRIATTELGADWIILPALAAGVPLADGLRLDLDARPVASDLLENERTIALRFHRPQHGDFVVRRLGAVPYGLYAAEGPLAARGFDPAAPWLGWAGEFATIGAARWLDETFAGARPALRLTSLAAQIQGARAGLGIAGLPLFVAARFPGLRRIPDGPRGFELEAWLVVPRQVRRLRSVRLAAALVAEACRLALR